MSSELAIEQENEKIEKAEWSYLETLNKKSNVKS
jgi:hypothetical protein